MTGELDFGESGDIFHVPGWEESDELSREDQLLLDNLSVPLPKHSPSPAGEIAVDFRRRLEELKVENPAAITRWSVRRLPKELYLIPYAIEDVHYSVYEKRRERSRSPFVSLTSAEVFDATPSDISQLQREQTLSSYLYLADKGLKENRLYRWATSEIIPGEEAHQPEQKFALRSLARLLKEKTLAQFTTKLSDEAYVRGAEHPLIFEDVARRATDVLKRRINSHEATDSLLHSSDERMWHLLVSRELERAESFARPLGSIVLKNSPEA